MNRFYHILLTVVILLFTNCCSKSPIDDGKIKRTVNIAVVLTQDSYDRWERIMTLAQKNISEATDITPVFKFYDEDSQDVMLLAYDLANDESIDCVIGCEDDENTEMLAYQMSRLRKYKPMFTFNTSQELIRKYSRMGFMWGLSECDITQSEVILTKIAQDVINTEVALIASNSTYGQTFVDWFAFQAAELGLDPLRICTYDKLSEIAPILEELSDLNCPIVCVPNTVEEAAEMIKNTDDGYFSHKAFNKRTIDILKKSDETEYLNMRGVSLIADPKTGFQDIYTARYGEIPIFGEAQLYDAIMVSCLAYAVASEFNITVNKAVSELLKTDGKHLGGWTRDAIKWSYNQIVKEHSIPTISGAIGELDFSPEKHTIINNSTYVVQYLSNYKFHQTEFTSRDGDGGSSSIHGAWIWNKVLDQEFDFTQEEADLGEWEGNKAILIAGSRGWDNYRHQADILAYYQLLKKNNFTDDDIILILADDLASNSMNPYPGQIIRDVKSLEDLYIDVQVDYRLDQITPYDLKNILLGKSSERLPVALNSTDRDNVLFLWSGHGSPGVLHWDENRQSVNGKFLSDLFNEMYSNGRYRKLFGVIEACYGGGVASVCEGTPKLLLMTAANDMETSKAEGYAPLWSTYLTNSFTSSLLSILVSGQYSVSFKDLYTATFSNTMGSHVTLYNVEYFGNVYFNYVNEYFVNYSERYSE